jgi:hypothetical protein
MALCARGLALIAALAVSGLEGQSPRPTVEEYPSPLVRERQQVLIGNVAETWELRWKAPPKPACEPSDVSLTCPCTGFAYGEGGELALVRVRSGKEIDRLELTELFKGADLDLGDIAILQRWEPDINKDFEASERADFLDVVARRKTVKIMTFADYDHDGQRSEFYLQIDAGPCGHVAGVVIGISKSNSKLHVFGTADKPDAALVFDKHIWDALSRARGPVEVVAWPCGDHGSEDETTVRLTVTSKGIEVVQRTYACPRRPGQRPKSEEPL